MDIIPTSSWSPPYYQNTITDLCNEFQQSAQLMQGLQQLIQTYPAVQSGKHYWRPVSEDGIEFSLESVRITRFNYVIAWSRILDDKEVLCAINLHHQQQAIVYVTIDHNLHSPGSKMECLFGPSSVPAELNVEERNGKSIRLTIPSRTLVIYN